MISKLKYTDFYLYSHHCIKSSSQDIASFTLHSFANYLILALALLPQALIAKDPLLHTILPHWYQSPPPDKNKLVYTVVSVANRETNCNQARHIRDIKYAVSVESFI
jgi:hypothetical protein